MEIKTNMAYVSGIYKITNNINGKCYIGSAINLKIRWLRHKNDLKICKHHSSLLQRAFDKYGENAFDFCILLYCSKNDLIFYEQRAIDTYKSEYNICRVAGSILGIKLSKETKLKMSKPKSEETKTKMSISQLGNKKWLGRNHTEETKIKMSLAQQNRTEETKAKMSAAQIGNTKFLGKTHTEATKLKISLSQKKRLRSN